MKSQIVFVNQSSGYLMIDIVNAFDGIYDERTIISGIVVERNTALQKEVKQERIIPYDRSTKFRRIFTWVWGFIQIVWLIRWKYPKAHLFLVTNPPFSTLLPFFCRNSFSFLIFDVYPDALIEYKVLKEESFIVRKWRKYHEIVFKRATRVITISSGMRENLLQYYPGVPIDTVNVWADGLFFKQIPKDKNPFITDQSLADKFVIMYSGNLGRTHDVDILVDIAEKLQDTDAFVLIIGGGEKRDMIDKKIEKLKLKNCRLLSLLPVQMLPYSMSAADLGVVSLGREASLLSVPSKTFSLLSAGRPLLCIADPSSELACLVKEHLVGESFSPSQLDQMVSFIRKLMQDNVLKDQLSKNALDASKKYTPNNASEIAAWYSA
ncbi:MAG: glycosyltransferase family 4 protein [Imperialibacter sp.]|uniref:glycosyltransferase family 4 protein n=1 Tax=Imperialibacter sp. TaxID=2038411 RepID=UPI0032EB63D2